MNRGAVSLFGYFLNVGAYEAEHCEHVWLVAQHSNTPIKTNTENKHNFSMGVDSGRESLLLVLCWG